MDKWLKRKAPGDPPTPETKSSIANSVARITNVDRKLSKKSATVVAQPKPIIPQVLKMTVLPPNSMHLILPSRKVEGRVSSTNSILNKASAVLSAPTAVSHTAKSAVGVLGAAHEISKRNASKSSDTAHRSNQVDSAHDLKVKLEECAVVAASRSIPISYDAPAALRGSKGKCDNALHATSDDSNDENNQRTLNIGLDPISNGVVEGSIKAIRKLGIIPKKASSCLQLMEVTGRDGGTEMDLSDSDSSDDESTGYAAEHLKEGGNYCGKEEDEEVAVSKPSIKYVLSAAARISAEVRNSKECRDSSNARGCEGEGSDRAVTVTVSRTGTGTGIGTVAKSVLGTGAGTGTPPDVGSGSGSSNGAVAFPAGGTLTVSSSSGKSSAVLTVARAVGAMVSNGDSSNKSCSSSSNSKSNSNSNDNNNTSSNNSNSGSSSGTSSINNSSISVGITVSVASCDSVTGAADVADAGTEPTVRTVGAVSATANDAAVRTICNNPETDTDTDRGTLGDTSTIRSAAEEVNVQGREAVTSMPTAFVGFTAEECGHGEGEGVGEREGDEMSLDIDEDSLIFPPIDTGPSITTALNEILDLTLSSSCTSPALAVPGTLGAKSLGVGEILSHLMEIRQQTLDGFVIPGVVKKPVFGLVPNHSVPAPYVRDPLQYSGPLGMLGRKVFRVRDLGPCCRLAWCGVF
jgi:hypothetical protein